MSSFKPEYRDPFALLSDFERHFVRDLRERRHRPDDTDESEDSELEPLALEIFEGFESDGGPLRLLLSRFLSRRVLLTFLSDFFHRLSSEEASDNSSCKSTGRRKVHFSWCRPAVVV